MPGCEEDRKHSGPADNTRILQRRREVEHAVKLDERGRRDEHEKKKQVLRRQVHDIEIKKWDEYKGDDQPFTMHSTSREWPQSGVPSPDSPVWQASSQPCRNQARA